MLIAKSDWEHVYALENFLDQWPVRAKAAVNLKGFTSLALLRHLLPKTFALDGRPQSSSPPSSPAPRAKKSNDGRRAVPGGARGARGDIVQ